MPEQDKEVGPLYEAESCPECNEDPGNMEWDEDQECWICPNCGEVQ